MIAFDINQQTSQCYN